SDVCSSDLRCPRLRFRPKFGSALSLTAFALRPPSIEIGDLIDLSGRHRTGHVAHLTMAVVAPGSLLEVVGLNDEVLLGHPFEPWRTELVVGTAVASHAGRDIAQRVTNPHQCGRRALAVSRGCRARLGK